MDEELILDSGQESGLVITTQARESLRIAASWSRFLAILGFTGIGFMVLAAIFVGSIFGMMPKMAPGFENIPLPMGFLSVLYLGIALLYFFPILYLYKFSDKMKAALRSTSTDALTEAFYNLGRHYKFIGILVIISIILYLLFILILVIGLAGQ